MEIINIQASDDSPSVILDINSGKFEISGKSMPENVVAYYQPVFDWLNSFAESDHNKLVFDFKLLYFNTASSKILLDIMIMLEEMHEAGKEITVKWHYSEEDEDMLEAGEEYAEMVDIPFETIAY